MKIPNRHMFQFRKRTNYHNHSDQGICFTLKAESIQRSLWSYLAGYGYLRYMQMVTLSDGILFSDTHLTSYL